MEQSLDLKRTPVVIVGAGLAGLNCALTLQKANIDYLILEQGSSVGGRVRTEEQDGFLLDVGFQVFQTAYPEAKAVMDYQQLDLQPLEPGALIRFNDKWVRMSDPIRRPTHAIGTMFNAIGNFADRLKLLKMKRHICSQSIEQLLSAENDCSTEQFLQNQGFTESIINHFFRPWFAGIFLEDELRTSANYFQFVFKMLSEGDISYPRAGIQSLPNEILRQLNQERVLLNCPVTNITSTTVQTQDRQVEASAIIIATDYSHAQQLMPDFEQSQPLRSFQQTRCTYFAADQSPSNEATLMLSGDSSDGPINHAIVMSKVSRKLAPPGQYLISVSLIGEHAVQNDSERIRKQLRDWFGAPVDSWRELRSFHIKEALPSQSPGFYSCMDSNTAERRLSEGQPLFCGDYCETTSVNGALRSGRMVAEHLTKALDDVESNQTN